MGETRKRIFRVIALISLIFVLIFLILLNLTGVGSVLYSKVDSVDTESTEEKELKIQIWELEREKQFLTRYCDNMKVLPDEDSQTVKIEIEYYTGKIPIETLLNVYTSYTQIYEVGTLKEVESNNLASPEQMRVYRIEMIEDPNTYLEYVSNRSTPYLYIIKDINSSLYLIDPIINNLRVLIDDTYYLESI